MFRAASDDDIEAYSGCTHAQPTERTTTLWGLSCKIDSRIWVNFTRSGLRLGSRHQEPPHTVVSRNLATVIVRSVLPGLRRRRTGLLPSGPKSSFCESLFKKKNILISWFYFTHFQNLLCCSLTSQFLCIYVDVCACARMCGCLFCTPDILESHPLIAAHLFSDQWLICSLYHQKIHWVFTFFHISHSFPMSAIFDSEEIKCDYLFESFNISESCP